MPGHTCVIKMNDGTLHEGDFSCHIRMLESLDLDADSVDDCGWKAKDGTINWGHGDSIKEK